MPSTTLFDYRACFADVAADVAVVVVLVIIV
jgi:hypothetical protein